MKTKRDGKFLTSYEGCRKDASLKVRMTEQMKDSLTEIAQEEGRTLSQTVCILLQIAIEQYRLLPDPDLIALRKQKLVVGPMPPPLQ